MSSFTPFAALIALDPGESLSDEGFYFQATNPELLDRIARFAVRDHKHDAHAAMADPTTAVALDVAAAGGALPSDMPLYVTYTLVDSEGGETRPVDAGYVRTPEGFAAPSSAPDAVVDYSTGTLLAGSVSYGVTVRDGLGGETTISPAIVAVIDPGHAAARVELSGLAAILADCSGGALGATWALWRSINGGDWYMIATGTGDALTDDGIAGDCSVSPPPLSTTAGANLLSVTVPSAGQPAGAVQFNIYADFDGSFQNPCRLGTYDISQYDIAQEFADLTALTGAPPPISTCFSGANKIDPDTDLLGVWKRAVATAADLPSVGNTDGDVRETLDDHALHAWDGGAWVAVPVGDSNSVIPVGNTFTGDFNLADVTDAGKVVDVDSAGAVNCTIDPGVYPVGAVLAVYQLGAGAVTFLAGAGVTIESYLARVATAGQFATVGLRQRAADIWALTGDLA